MAFKVEHEFKGLQGKPEALVLPSLLQGSTTKNTHWEPVVINLVDEIDSDTAIAVAAALRKAEETGQPFVPFYIDSPGGSVYGLMSIIEAMRRCKIPIYTFTSGIAASCAACIFSAGKRRFMSKYARLLIHDVSVDFSGETTMTSSNIKVEATEMRVLNRTIFQIMAENTGHPTNFFVDLIKTKRNNDIYVNAERALEWKLATDIGFPTVRVQHEVTMALEFTPDTPPKVEKKRPPYPVADEDEEATSGESDGEETVEVTEKPSSDPEPPVLPTVSATLRLQRTSSHRTKKPRR